jgi:membrane peptidoglycan carboxypeptidase
VLFADEGESHRAVSESTAFLMASMLTDVINSGTAYRARQAGFTHPAAGKTGTTNDYLDAWFVGFTPHVVTGVWVGFDQPRSIIANGYAGELAVPMWAGFMKAASRGLKADWFDRPANVTAVNVCRLSGKLPNQGCGSVPVVLNDGFVENRSLVYTEYFVRGTQPATLCPLHGEHSFVEKLAGIFGKELGKPVSVGEVGSVPPAASTSGSIEISREQPKPEEKAQTAPAEEQKKKKGFWSRVFGRSDEDKKKEEAKKKEEEKKKVIK